MAIGWHAENFRRTGKRFRELDHYLQRAKPQTAQTAEDVVAIFEGFAARGLATIREVKRDEHGG